MKQVSVECAREKTDDGKLAEESSRWAAGRASMLWDSSLVSVPHRRPHTSKAWSDVAEHLRVLQKIKMAIFQPCLCVKAYLKGPVT